MKPDPRETLRQKLGRALQLGRTIRFVWESAKGWTLINGFFLLVQGVLPLLPLYLMKLLVDAVAAGAGAPDKGNAIRHVVFLALMIGAATLVSALVRLLAGMVSEWQAYIVTDHMNDVLLTQSVKIDLPYYESALYYDTLHRAQREAPFRPLGIVNGLTQIGQNSISLLAIAALLLSFHWVIAIVLLAAVAAGAAIRFTQTGRMYRWQREHTASERKLGYFNGILTGGGYAKEVRLFDLGPLFLDRARHLRRLLRLGRMGLARSRSLADFSAQALATAAIYGSYAFLAYQAVSGTITLGDMVMYSQAFQRVQGALQGILGSLAGLYEDNLFISNLYEFLDLKPAVSEPVPATPIPRPLKGGIVLDRVSFHYPGVAGKALDEVSLAIKPGEVVALVGENGSGKTTLIKLLCRLYEPSGGTISLDGTDLRQYETKALRREIAIIFQDYARYHLSAGENIWLGDAALPPDAVRIAAAARRAGAAEVIQKLPLGYDTILGKMFANGEELSGGEWQKVALARAFMRDAQILVLDEPTSSMDARAEYDVFLKFRQLIAGRTAILISHRFSTVRMADRIYVLQQGKIIEGGTHDELVLAGQTYARLFEMQARHYR